MLIYHRTDLLDSNAQTLVNTVNCVGVMGKGIAAAFKARYPDMFVAYKRICDAGALEPGKLWLWQGAEHWVLNFPTKKHWRYPAKVEWIEAGLEKFVAEYSRRGITDVSFPRLGCGNGGLDWDVVRPVMERYLASLPINVFIHDYTVTVGLPEHLDDMARKLACTVPVASSFDGFLENLDRVLSAAEGKLMTLESREEFSASLTSELNLQLSLPEGEFEIEREDLRALWVALSNGIVTRQKAEWSAGEAADQVLAVMSIMPGVRPVEIQRRKSTVAEIALELKPNSGVMNVGALPKVQNRFEWA
jgi:O-acetyl-ADP-ribose deacetylase (regulator of RNase III)